jgi:peroxiredoxin
MLEVGQEAPEFSLHDSAKNIVTLGENKGKKIVLAFFPAAFTGVCSTEMCTFQDSLSALNDANAIVLGIDVDAPFSNQAFIDKNNLTFPILSDYARTTVDAYGVALENFAGMDGYTAAQRSIFIVDESGNLMWKWIADNAGQEPDYDKVLSIVNS